MNDKYPYKYKNILSVYCDVSNLGRAILLKRINRQRTAKKKTAYISDPNPVFQEGRIRSRSIFNPVFSNLEEKLLLSYYVKMRQCLV